MPHVIKNPNHALTNARFLWAMLVLGVLAVVLIGVVLVREDASNLGISEGTGDEPLLLALAWAMPAVMIPVGLVIRWRVFHRSPAGDPVTPSAYLAGCLVAWAITDAAAMVAVGVMIMSNRLAPSIYPALACALALVLQWPTGSPMRPHHGSRTER